MNEEIFEKVVEVLNPLTDYAKRCHEASLALVRAGIGERVARGVCPGVGSQHSWVVVGEDCYAKDAEIIDPTLWAYLDNVDGVFVGSVQVYGHTPKGAGSIWNYGQPVSEGGDPIQLTPSQELSGEALQFLDLLGDLDCMGMMALANAPVGGWPSKEIFTAMYETEQTQAMVPIDVIGMLTDLNPGELYR